METESYIQSQLNKYRNVPKNKNISVALIGLGPHAKRIYLNYFKKHKTNLALVIELESKRDSTRKYLIENGFKNTKIFSIEDRLKDNETLPKIIFQNLLAVCNTLEITHIIISTEPKAHFMYLDFALRNNINVLTDKPITVVKNMTSLKSIEKVREQYYKILKLAEDSTAMCNVMCQRQYHKGYEYIKKLLDETVTKYKIPITYIDIYHCDGNWEMPHDLTKENHPYKYGYGKLFHSGYHFIDLLSDFIKINSQLNGSKKITKGYVYSNFFTPNDELNIFNFEDYKRIFKDQDIPEYYNENKKVNFKKYGEKNYFGLLKFTNNYGQTITNANLNLLHYGISRRAWIETRDFYKSNGRIRHERINIQVGTLLNIQVHSYQSKEIKDRNKDNYLEENPGGLEHFDIDIYRNSELIGGKPFERITLGSLYTEKEKKDFLGYNELSREIYLNNFFKGKCSKGCIEDQKMAMEILYSCAKGLYNYYHNNQKEEKIEINYNKNYLLDLKILKELNKNNLIENQKKDIIKINELVYSGYEFNVIMNKLKLENKYETYIFVGNGEVGVGGLLSKSFNNIIFSYIYFNILMLIIKIKKLELLKLLIKYKNNTKLLQKRS